MRVALLGFGKVAESTHVPGFLAAKGGAWPVVAIAEPSPERRAVAARVCPGARLYDGAETLLRDEAGKIDLADVVAPPFLHARLVLAALRSGAHVLCEKPLSLDTTEVSDMAKEARRKERVLFTVDNWRRAPLVLAAVSLVRSGELGRLRFVGWSVRRKAADPGAAPGGKTWREDPKLALGGVLVDHGWHALTVVHALLGDGRRRVRARLVDEPGRGDVEARVRLDQEEVRVAIRLTWRASKRANRARLHGTRANARLEDDRLVRADAAPLTLPEKLSQGSTHPEWFPPVLDALAREVSDPTARGESLRQAIYCASTTKAAYESASHGGEPVDLD